MTIRFNNNFGKEIARRYDARTERTQYGNVLRTLRRTIARVAREGEDVASGICFRDRFESTNRFELGNGALCAAARRVSDDCRRSQDLRAQFDAERIILKNTQILTKTCLTVSQNWSITNSVESDGVRLIFLTARGGAAFLTVRDAVVGRFFLPLLSVESVGRSPEFPMSQAAPKERVRRRRVEPLREEEYRRNFETIVDLCRVALAVQEQMLLADFERRAIFRETTRLIRERLERLRQRQLEDARDKPKATRFTASRKRRADKINERTQRKEKRK